MTVIKASHQRLVIDALAEADENTLVKMWEGMAEPKLVEKVRGEWWLMIPCQCDPPQEHGPHWVQLRRVQRGGDLRGRIHLEDIELPTV